MMTRVRGPDKIRLTLSVLETYDSRFRHLAGRELMDMSRFFEKLVDTYENGDNQELIKHIKFLMDFFQKNKDVLQDRAYKHMDTFKEIVEVLRK